MRSCWRCLMGGRRVGIKSGPLWNGRRSCSSFALFADQVGQVKAGKVSPSAWQPMRTHPDIVRHVMAYALNENEHRRSTAENMVGSMVLQPLGYKLSSRGAYDLLVDTGVWKKTENPHPYRHQRPLLFPPQVDADVDAIMQSHKGRDADASNRTHFKSLAAYTIDDPQASEIDDAVSVVRNEYGGHTLLVHVADPSRVIDPGSSIDMHCRSRGASVFLPERVFPMMPQRLADDVLSLVPGRSGHSLTFSITLNDDGSLAGCEFFPSMLHNVVKISYAETDALLEAETAKNLPPAEEHELLTLHRLLLKRNAWRKAKGGSFKSRPNVLPYVRTKGNKVEYGFFDEGAMMRSPSRNLIMEAMVIAGEAAAHHAFRHHLPFPYRTQPSTPSDDSPAEPSSSSWGASEGAPEALDDGHVALVRKAQETFAMTSYIAPAHIQLERAPHHLLGIEGYSQVTSPIRRYVDLLAHYQLKAHYRGESLPFSSKMLSALLSEIELSIRHVDLLERRSERFWKLKFLEDREDKPILGTLVSMTDVREYWEAGEVAKVWLSEGMFLADFPLKRTIRSNEVLRLRVVNVCAISNMLELEECV